MVRLQHKTSVNQEELQKIGKKHALKNRTNFIIVYIYTPETRFSDPRFSEILDLVNKTQLPSYFTKYPDSI